MPTASILVIGAANVDIKAAAASSPRPGVSTPGRVHVAPGGAARNVAEILARLGLNVSLRSVVGNDLWGSWIIDRTTAAGVETSRVMRRPGRSDIYVTLGGRGVADTSLMDRAPPDAEPAPDTAVLVLDANLPASLLAAHEGTTARRCLLGTSPRKVIRLRSVLHGSWLVCLTAQGGGASWEACPTGGSACRTRGRGGGPARALDERGQRPRALERPATAVDLACRGQERRRGRDGRGGRGGCYRALRPLEGWRVRVNAAAAARAAALTVRTWDSVAPDVARARPRKRASPKE